MMKYQAIIFDLDGTIINTEPVWQRATHCLIESRNIILTPEIEKELHFQIAGAALPKSCAIIKEFFNLPEELPDLIREKQNHALAFYKEGICFIRGFKAFHRRVVALNLKMGIATNADTPSLERAKEQLNLASFFGQHIYNIALVGDKYKPNPDIYLYAAEKINIAAEQCIAIEDSAHGVAAAKAAGMLCLGINTGKKPEQLKQADHVVNHYHEIKLDNLLYDK